MAHTAAALQDAFALAPSPARAKVERASGLRTLHPAYFALVMATGVLGVACRLLALEPLPELLFAINVPAYAVLVVLTVARAVRHPRPFLDDFRSHQRAPGFFTIVAATSVLGMQFAVQREAMEVAAALWGCAIALWLVLTYAIFTTLTVTRDKPSLDGGIHGGWLTSVVATQSLVVLGTVVAPQLGASMELVLLALLSLWLAGGMIYVWLIALIFYRYTFFRFAPSDLLPTYWINMGAMAISALAGALLVEVSGSSPLLTSMLPFVKGYTLLFWATASWWIPLLVALGVWRYVLHKMPLTYDPLYWGAVFPLAMYTSATYRLGKAIDVPLLVSLPRYFVAAALTAWLMTFLGLVFTLVLHARPARKRRSR
jgi:tellurite resistance protein TehA-like permease